MRTNAPLKTIVLKLGVSFKKRKWYPQGATFLFLLISTKGFEPKMGANSEHSEERSDRETVLWTVSTFLQLSVSNAKTPLLSAKKRKALFGVFLFCTIIYSLSSIISYLKYSAISPNNKTKSLKCTQL